MYGSAMRDDQLQLIFYIGLLVLVGSTVITRFRGNIGSGVRAAIVWAAIFFGLLGLYAYRDAFSDLWTRMRADLMPSEPVSRLAGAVVYQPNMDGDFTVNARINGVEMTMILDTGASLVSLRQEDARRLGIDPDSLVYDRVMYTANGTAPGAFISLKEIDVGGIVRRDVGAVVMRGDLGQPLLGMSFLTKLTSFEVTPKTLTLRD